MSEGRKALSLIFKFPKVQGSVWLTKSQNQTILTLDRDRQSRFFMCAPPGRVFVWCGPPHHHSEENMRKKHLKLAAKAIAKGRTAVVAYNGKLFLAKKA